MWFLICIGAVIFGVILYTLAGWVEKIAKKIEGA